MVVPDPHRIVIAAEASRRAEIEVAGGSDRRVDGAGNQIVGVDKCGSLAIALPRCTHRVVDAAERAKTAVGVRLPVKRENVGYRRVAEEAVLIARDVVFALMEEHHLEYAAAVRCRGAFEGAKVTDPRDVRMQVALDTDGR